jgi:tetratricopeptide (TPR) repeat protein
MGYNSSWENTNDFKELLTNYRSLRVGNEHQYIDEDAFDTIIEYYAQRNQIAKALEAANFATEQFSYSSVLLLKKADLLNASGKFNEALEILEKAEILDTSDINLYILKTDSYLATDQQDKAIWLLENTIKKFEGEEKVELLFELADVYDDYENFEKVFDCLAKILQIEPTNEEALYKICYWADYTNRNEESIVIHKSIIDNHPYCELAWFNLGSAFQGLKLYEKAIDAYKYVLVIDEKMDYAYRNIGDAYMRLRKYKEAVEYLLKVLELAKPEEVIYEAIGYCYEKLKQPSEARFYYKKASHLNAENANTLHKLAGTYMTEEKWTSAIKYLETALKINKKNAEFNFAIAQCYFQMEDYNQTIYYITIALTLKPNRAKSWELLMICLYAIQAYDEGLNYVENALAATNYKPLFLYYKVAFLIANGYSKEAILVLEEALTKAPKLLKYLIELNPKLLHNQTFVDCILRFKK